MTIETNERLELSITRTFNAPASAVWEIWSKREHMIRWWGPKNFTTPELEVDFRVGGAYRACIKGNESGRESWMSGHFVELVENERIVFTFKWDVSIQAQGVETLITVTLAEHEGRTTQTFHQTPFLDADTRDDHIKGWTSFIEKEQLYAESLAKRGPADPQ
jgi:uncharacterized protein YndB with AHSA1/START domain